MLKKNTGEWLSSLLLHYLNEHNLPVENLRGQSYDGTSNMSGKYKGVKTLIQNNSL